ncbi:MAG: NAD+ synthase [Deltaproteobacteria bacterium]|nr:NAD+ synthase [Deltaproteobacteria bacterium]
MKIGMIQRNFVVGDYQGNVEKILSSVEKAKALGADLAVTSELSLCGYPPKDLLERDRFVSAGKAALEEVAQRASIHTIVGFVDHDPTRTVGRRIYNAAALVGGGKVVSIHHKALLPTYDVFDEHRHFEPALLADVVPVAVMGRRMGLSICEDIWNDPDFWKLRLYPLDPIATLVERGAEVLLNISASPFTMDKRTLRPRMLAAQARKHRRPLVFVNQVGGNDDLLFDGHSLAFDASGTIIARAREFEEDLVIVDLAQGTGAIRDLKDDTEAALDALVMGTRDYAHKCGFRSAVIGLSGGVDSALVASIAVRALGPKNVLGVSMPSRFSSQHSKDDAEELARHLGIAFETIPIEGPFSAFLDALAPAFKGTAPGVAEENIQARCRGVILMALSNKFGHLLLTTGNKSELAVGYCTLYGDMAGGLAVISDVPKTMVYRLARKVNEQAGRVVIPESTLTKPPSAELRPGQVDQDLLPPYDILDQVLELHVEEQLEAPDIVARGFDPSIVNDVLRMVRVNEYKRRQAAPGLKLTSKAFGPGRRMPIAQRWRGN